MAFDCIRRCATDAEFSIDFHQRRDPDVAAALALLLHAPDPDFEPPWPRPSQRSTARRTRQNEFQRCVVRAPWRFDSASGFVYVGDEHVERSLMRPARTAIARTEFSGGVRREFESAHSELAVGDPTALKQAVHEASCAVESAMKVVLDRSAVAYDEQRNTAQPLFERLVAAGIVPRYMQSLVLAAVSPRNRRGGHGAGSVPHAVDASEAEAVVAAAAGAISYLASRLP